MSLRSYARRLDAEKKRRSEAEFHKRIGANNPVEMSVPELIRMMCPTCLIELQRKQFYGNRDTVIFDHPRWSKCEHRYKSFAVKVSASQAIAWET